MNDSNISESALQFFYGQSIVNNLKMKTVLRWLKECRNKCYCYIVIISTGNHIEPEYDFYGVVTLKGVDRSVLIEIIKKKLPSTVSILSLNTPISQQGREKDAIMSEIRKNQ